MADRKQAVFIEAHRSGYGPDQIRRTMTVADLIGALEEMADAYGGDAEVFLRHDRGYTYGGITWDDFIPAKYDEHRVYLDDDDEYDEEW